MTLIADSTWNAFEYIESFGKGYGNIPEIGSPAATELSTHEEVGPNGRWPEKALETAYTLAGAVFIGAAGQYLFALNQLLQVPMALFGYQVVTRSLVESAARAWWILDPAISPRERVVRASVERWFSIVELGKVASSIQRDPSEQKRRELEFRAQIAALGLTEKLDKRGHLIGFEDSVRVDSTPLVHNFLTSLGIRHGEFWYRTMSGVSHSALYSYMHYHKAKVDPLAERAELTPDLPIEAVANAAVLGIGSYMWAVEHHARLYGRDSETVGRKRIETVGRILTALR